MGSIIVTAFKIIGSLPFIHILKGTVISTHSLFHGISSATLAGNSPYFFVELFVRWHTSYFVTSFWAVFLMPGHYKCWLIVASVLSNRG